jgi:hypothetical protein
MKRKWKSKSISLLLNSDNLNVCNFRIMSKEEFTFLGPDIVIGLNIGGQIFETTVEVLIADSYSILAACCRVNPPFSKTSEGYFYFDRDWWLFRHILAFLRSSKLPNDLETLKELYQEASFYRLEKLQIAIENVPVNQVVRKNENENETIPDKENTVFSHSSLRF